MRIGDNVLERIKLYQIRKILKTERPIGFSITVAFSKWGILYYVGEAKEDSLDYRYRIGAMGIGN